jgi:hypothetical protein
MASFSILWKKLCKNRREDDPREVILAVNQQRRRSGDLFMAVVLDDVDVCRDMWESCIPLR